jgi:hypothetical protein
VSGHVFAGLLVASLLIAGLALERLIAGCRAAFAFEDSAGLAFPVLHLARDLAWGMAIVVWCARWIVTTPPRPAFSMRPRPSELRVEDCGLRIEDER